ncbi:MAG: nuclear transport factor 2 family protein [Proteobacteria bacterium]|nr:nuclear transport factor 2 family protein [Pseudomonadota bacterium]
MDSTLSTSERLEIELACQRIGIAYLHAIDHGDPDAAAECFAEQGVLARPMQPQQLIRGREAIRASLKSRPKGLVTRHLATNVVIDVASRDAASGLCVLTMIGCSPAEGAQAPHESAGPLYFGEFRDRFVRVAGEWKILERLGSIAVKY